MPERPSTVSYAQWKKDLQELIVLECQRRLKLRRNDLVPLPEDGPEEITRKNELLGLTLIKWARSPEAYIADMGWAPDPKGDFGGRGKIPEGLAPPGMVPIILYPEQTALIHDLDRIINTDGVLDLNLLKSRQVAATALLVLFFEHGWRFRPGFTGLFGSYEKDRIDPGGKGHRQGDSLFSRLRAVVDAFVWQLPHIPFNLHAPMAFKGRKADPDNPAWLGPSDDSLAKVQRPRWYAPWGEELFPRAYRNYITGKLPGDKFGKGDIYTVAFMDEYGEYDAIAPGADRKARDTLRFNCNHIVTAGTIPEGGGAGSEFKRLWDAGDTYTTLINRMLHWSDVGTYMLGSWFICRECGEQSEYGNPLPGPGPYGMEKPCTRCGHRQFVLRPKDVPGPGEVSSPAYVERCESLHWNKIAIARYLNCDFRGGAGDTFFTGFRSSRALIRSGRVSDYSIAVEGFDPGSSMEYPAAWLLALFDPRRAVPRVVGYWMAAQTYAEWWVPFFKRWRPASLERHTVQFGTRAGRRFSELGYPAEALEMLQRVSAYPLGRAFGDASGASHWMNDSPYDVLAGWNVHVAYSREKKREMVVRRGRDWAARVEIDPEIANIHPPSPSGRPYPSILEVFEGAKPVEPTGQARPPLDVDAKDPPYAKNACDAWFYACHYFLETAHAVPDEQGEWGIQPYAEESEPFVYGGDGSLG